MLSFGVSLASAASDLSIGSVSTVPADTVFAKEANSVKINSISNSGDPLTNINVALYASDVSGGTVPINTTTIASLASGGTATVTLVDPTIRSSEGGTVTYIAVVDPDNLISETNEGNNNKSSSAESVKYNGYKGKRYTDGNDITTQATFEGKYGLVYSAGNTAYNGAYWAAQTYSWSSTDLPIPAGATVVSVRLYQPYTWNYLTTDPAFIMSFNGNSVNPIATYKDKKNYGTYAELPSGLYVYNVTSLFNPSGNTITITPEDGNNYGMWGAYMVVVYQDPAGKTEKIWINDEFDNLYAGTSYAVTSDEATTYAPFSGVSTSGVSKATSIAILASANEVGKSKFYFNNQEYSGFWADYLSTPQIGFSSYNVTGAIQEGTDTASLQSYISGSSGDNMYAINSILMVEYSATAPVANFTANVTSGTAPLTVQFTDQSTGSPTSWLWDFGDGTTATGQNSSHTYSTAGTYNVNLTVTGPGGSDSEVKTGYIVVSNTAAPVANFNVVLDGDGKMPHGLAPITVSFTDASIGTVDTYKWEYKTADSGTWTTFGSGVQNPTNIMFSDAGTYDIRLTVTNSGGSSNKTIAHAFAAGKLHDYLTTINSGIVSGDLYVNSQSPAITTKTCSYTLPASGSNISWARVFVDVYSGSGDNNWPVGITTELDPTGSGSWSTLGVEKGDIQSESNTASPDGQPYVYPVNDHMTKVYSDYEVWYDVTGLLTSTTPQIRVTSSDIGAPVGPDNSFDGRIKGITLVVAYNDGSTKQVKYIVNHGNDWMTGSSSTAFDASSFNSGWTNATIKEVAHSSTDAIYTLNSGSISKTSLGSSSYWKYNSFNVTSALNPAALNSFGFTNNGASFKICLATLTATYPGTTQETAPVPNFTANTTSGTAPLMVQFTDSSTGNVTSYSWDFGDGNNSTNPSPSHTYSTAGTYNVNLTVTGPGGSNSMVKTGYIVVNNPAAPVASFTATPTSGNTPLTVQFTDASTGAVSSYVWDFNGDGIVDNTTQNPSYTYSSVGTYTVNLTVIGPGGRDSEVKTNYITVNETAVSAPVAGFTATPLVGPAPLSVTFTDLSTNSPSSWKWEYNNGSGWTQFSTDKNATFSFTTACPYDIRLTSTNSGGSDDETKLHYIAVATGREPLTTVQSGVVSGDLFISSPTTYATGVTEVSKTFTLPASAAGNIRWAKLYVNTYSGSAANTYALTSTVKLDGNGDGTYETTLGNETMDIASETNGNSYPLNDHINKVYSDYEAQYDVTNLISASNPSVNVKNQAISGKSFEGRIKGVTLVAAYNDPSSTNQTYYWVNHGGDWSSPANGQTTFNTAGLVSGWVNAESKIRQFSSSDANYTFNGITKINGGSTPNLDGLNTWDVTNNITAGQDSTLAYSKGSSFKTTLATLKVKYVTQTAPVANFTATPTSGDSPLTVQFTDASTGTVASYEWDFGDGTNSTEQTPSHIYSTSGTYNVNFTVTGPGGSDSEVKAGYIVVNEALSTAPIAAFAVTPTSGDVPLAVQFTDQSTGTPTSWIWDFGDGNNTTGQNVTHIYTSAGIYIANLTVSNANGTNSTSASITVTEKNTPILPIANFSANTSEGYAPLAVQFTNMSENAVSLIWDFGDGMNSTEQNPVHTYSEAGNYTVNLTASNENGTDSKFATINVFEKSAPVLPLANFSSNVTEGFAPLFVQFTDLSENATVINWDFGDGTNSTEKNPLHIYNTFGNHTVNLTASNENGTASISTVITVLKQPAVLPVANFSSDVTTGNTPLSVQFTDMSKDATAWNWDFGDGAKSTEQNSPHTYNASGIYTVTLTVSNEAGIDNETKTGYIKVTSAPSKFAAAFTVSPISGNAPLKVVFADKSTGSPSYWKWSFGDGTYSTARNPVHTYRKAGKYTISLTVKNAKYSSSVTKKYLINVTNYVKPPVAAFAASPTYGNAPLKVAFTDRSKGSPTSWKWSFGDGTYSTDRNPVHTYSKAGKYTVSLTVKNSAGKCSITGFNYIKVAAPLKPPVAAFYGSPTSGKAPLKVTFVDKSSGNPTSWKWSFGDGTYSTARNPVHAYTKAGKYTVTLTAKNAKGSSTKTTYGYIKVYKK